MIYSKNKLAPLKQCTFPRLELQAAVLAAKADYVLQKNPDIKFDQSYFWVDSEIVLKYIKNETRKFHVFVGNQISIDRQLTDPNQRGHIPGEENPADVLSTGCTVDQLDELKWRCGPQMLMRYKGQWVTGKVDSNVLPENDPEVMKVCLRPWTAPADTHKAMMS